MLFEEFLADSVFGVYGFSYGAQKALNYVLETKNRVDFVQLFSPAFFEEKDEKFRRVQLLEYSKNSEKYMCNFYQKISKNIDLAPYFGTHSRAELEELLYFSYKAPLKEIARKHIKIEIFLGGCDEIIDSFRAAEFFKNFGTVYFLKNRDHVLIDKRL